MARIQCTDVQARPPEFLGCTSVTLDAFQRRGPPVDSPCTSPVRAGRCRGLCRYRALLDLQVHVRIPAREDGTPLPVERLHTRL
jgi:hypothetical protein